MGDFIWRVATNRMNIKLKEDRTEGQTDEMGDTVHDLDVYIDHLSRNRGLRRNALPTRPEPERGSAEREDRGDSGGSNPSPSQPGNLEVENAAHGQIDEGRDGTAEAAEGGEGPEGAEHADEFFEEGGM